MERYWEEARELARRARDGELTQREYADQMEELTAAFIALLFLLAGGNATLPGAGDEVKEAEAAAAASVGGLSRDIYSGRYSGENGDDLLNGRLLLWVFMLAGVYTLGKIYNSRNQNSKLVWRLGATEQHCSTCSSYNGRVMTAAQWQKEPHRPQSRSLECGGWRCDCSLVEI